MGLVRKNTLRNRVSPVKISRTASQKERSHLIQKLWGDRGVAESDLSVLSVHFCSIATRTRLFARKLTFPYVLSAHTLAYPKLGQE